MNIQTQKSILVVEDEAVYRQALADKLRNEGFSVLGAKNGVEGLALAKSKNPDLILLDVQMPKMDGLTMLQQVRDFSAWGKTVPVFILTALSSDNEQRMNEVTRLEPTYYLEKSNITMADLIEKIQVRLTEHD